MARDSFTIDDLKSGFVVELKSGKLKLVLRVGKFTKILMGADGKWTYLSRWSSDLKRRHVSSDHDPFGFSGYRNETIPSMGEDIVRVYGLVEGTDNYEYANQISTKGRKVIWTRVVPKRMTLEDIEQALGFPVELVTSRAL